MEYLDPPRQPTIEETVETLAQTVAHLALQLTVAQLQLRALGTVIEQAGLVAESAVAETVTILAEENAGAFLRANMGPEIAAMVDIPELERQVVEYLASS